MGQEHLPRSAKRRKEKRIIQIIVFTARQMNGNVLFVNRQGNSVSETKITILMKNDGSRVEIRL